MGTPGMTPIIITVPGVPVPKARPRFTKTGRTYTPGKTKAYEDLIKGAGGAVMDGTQPLTGPLHAVITVYLPIPKSWPTEKKLAAERLDVLPTGRPDIDNFVKAALDGLNGVAFVDDSQVVRMHATKFYSAKPKLTIAIHPMPGRGSS